MPPLDGAVLAPAWPLLAAPTELGVPPVPGETPDEPSLQPWRAATSVAAATPIRLAALM